MITHCPSCHTHFRVHAEQLAVRAGQVRCGKCARVFDALEHLIEESIPAHADRSGIAREAAGAGAAEAEYSPALNAADAQSSGGEAQKPAMADSAHDRAEPGHAEAPQAAIAEPAMSEVVGSGAAAAIVDPFDFGKVAATASAEPGRRWLWLTGALLLLLVLLAQAAHHYRSAIVLLFPEAKPYAAALCARLGCDLPLPRRIDLMSIDASDLQADTSNPNVMVLSATIKNRAIFNQQHPLLELTLTDAQDQPVVRRVLAPQDYLGKAASAQTGFGANTEIAIKMFIEGSQVKATGYRLYLFYP